MQQSVHVLNVLSLQTYGVRARDKRGGTHVGHKKHGARLT
jgi:hypothetical protein